MLKSVKESFLSLSRIPSVKDGFLLPIVGDVIRSTLLCSQRDHGVSPSVSRSFLFHSQNGTQMHLPTPMENVLLYSPSPSGEKLAIVKENLIQIFSQNTLLLSLDTTALHGAVNVGDLFSSFEWTKDEEYIVYTAEKKQPEKTSFFKTEKAEGPNSIGTSFDIKEDWCEQFAGICCPTGFILNISQGSSAIIPGLDQEIRGDSLGQFTWTPDEEGIVFVNFGKASLRNGIKYFNTRPSKLQLLTLSKDKSTLVSLADLTKSEVVPSATCPRFSPNGSKLVFVSANAKTHNACSELLCIDWTASSERTIRSVVPIVKSPEHPTAFPGLYLHQPGEKLPRRIWCGDGTGLVVASEWRGKRVILHVNTETGQVSPLLTNCSDKKYDGSWHVVDVVNNATKGETVILSVHSAPNSPPQAYLLTLKHGQTEVDFGGAIPLLSRRGKETDAVRDGVQWQQLVTDDGNQSILIVGPKEPTGKVVLFSHGGPHASFAAEYKTVEVFLVMHGFTIISPNYRGSLGFGQDNCESLLGKVGDQDVKEVYAGLQRCIDDKLVKADEIYLMGGSHGGFLTCHLAGQYPDAFVAAACRNPVIDVASMIGITDIPDWCEVETGNSFGPEFHLKAYQSSPISHVHKVKIPFLLLLGAKDKRVPMQQGHMFYTHLKRQGVPTRMILYENSSHDLDVTCSVEADAWINICMWFLSRGSFYGADSEKPVTKQQ